MNVASELAKLCDLPTPHFEFDAAFLSGDARKTLDALARCLVSGPAKGRELRLVGHADPRGDAEYNLALGQRRAGSVEVFLGQRGVPSERMASSSRGELEARGRDEAGWAEDRRVDIVLAD